jgi:DNA polymerase-1
MTRGKTLYLVDGSALIYRAFFAFIRNPLINSKGENTSAAYGFVNSLLKIVREEEPDYLAVVLDTKEPTFRHEKYEEYKSTRAKMPDELVEQLPRVYEAIKALNIVSLEKPGWEADDIIGTLAKAGEKKGLDVWCVTGDKDFFQLVSERVRIYNPKKSGEDAERYGPEEVEKKFGVRPELVIDKLALMGDSSDNVPGIPGVGPKTADALLAQFGSLDKILKGADRIKAKGVRTKVSENGDFAILSRELVTIDVDVPLEATLEDLKRKPIDFEACKKLFVELEFTSFIKQLLPEAERLVEDSKDDAQSASEYETVSSISALKKLIKKMKSAGKVAVDTETTSLNALEAELVGVSLCTETGKAFYVPLGHTAEGSANVPYGEAVAALKSLLEDPKAQKFGQNIKYDYQVLKRAGIEIDPISFDTMLASYVLNPSGRQHSLDFLALTNFDHQMQPIKDLIGTGKSQRSFATVDVEAATRYAAEDADFTFRLYDRLSPQLKKLKVDKLYYDIELPLIPVLAAMEAEGIRIDRKFLAKLSKKMTVELKEICAEIYEQAGGEFNINSTQQLSHILFDKLGLPTRGKTAKKTGYSTDSRVLEELAEMHPFPQLILDYRQLTKLKNTYVDALPRLISEVTGRVHTSFNQTIAATGRLSSTEPNLQNIPIRTEAGREIRRAFVPRDPDHVLVSADYSQVELRVLAHYSGDKGLIEAFKRGEDIHTRTAAEVHGVAFEEVTPEMRRVAKTANFAVIYGVTAYGLSQQTELAVDESRDFIETYFDRYPGIRKYMDDTKAFAHDKGYVTTLFGRRRYLPELKEKRANIRQFAERVAINTPIQGTAADIIKIAMLDIFDRLKKMPGEMVLQVHDELVFDVPKKGFEALIEVARDGMENAVKLKVPLVADIGVGDDWFDCK